MLFPDHESLSVEETQLAQEIQTWHPNTDPDGFEFFEVEGTLSWGLNLDGEVSANDFTHLMLGIDNEYTAGLHHRVSRAGGVEYIFQNKAILDEVYNRMMIEPTEVDSLENDDSVVIKLYRGMDRLLTDATGQKVMAGGTQRLTIGARKSDSTAGWSDCRWRSHYRADRGNDHALAKPQCAVGSCSKMRASSSISVQSRQQACLLAGATLTPVLPTDPQRLTHHLSNGQISASLCTRRSDVLLRPTQIR